MTTKKIGRPPKMTGGAPHTIYLPAHVWEWLIKQGASQTITRMTEEKMEKEDVPFQVDDMLIVNNPNAGFDMLVSFRGPAGYGKSMVYDPKGGGQFPVNNEWLRRQEPAET